MMPNSDGFQLLSTCRDFRLITVVLSFSHSVWNCLVYQFMYEYFTYYN